MEYNNTDGIRHYGANSHEWIGVVLDPKVQHSEVGMQVKVAIMGYHPTDTSVVRDEDIQYAQILLPVTAGNGGGNMNQTVSLSVGTAVYGKFTDGSARQQPMILGQFPLTSKTRYGKGRFEAKDGFGGNLKPGNLLGRDTALGLNTRPCVPRALPKGSGSDKTAKRETDKEALKAAGIDPDGEPKVGEVKKPEGNDLSPQERQDTLNSDLTTADKLGPESDVLVYGEDGKTEYQRGLERLGASPEEAAQQAARERASILEDRKEFEEAAAFEAALNAPVTDEERANVDANLNQ